MNNRMGYILKIILSSKEDYISAEFIQEQLNKIYHCDCNIKTIYNNIEKLNDFLREILGIEIFIKTKRKNGYYINEEYFSDAQLRFLYDAIASSEALSQKESQILFERLASFSSAKQLERLDIKTFEKENLNDIFIKMDIILTAITTKKAIVFEYVRFTLDQDGNLMSNRSTNGNYTKDITGQTYLVSPYEVMMQSGHYYLLSYNSIRKEQLSIYRIDRMERVRMISAPFIDIREMWDMKQLKKQAINMYFSNDVIDLKFIFDKSVFRTIVDQFGSHLEVHADVSGRIVGEVSEVTLTEGLIGWIMMLGDHITILEPVSLKNKVVEHLTAALSNYK